MQRGVFHKTVLLGWVDRTLCAGFTIKLANPRFRNVTTSQKSWGRPLEFFFDDNIVWNLGMPVTNLRVGQYMLSTQASNFVLLKTLRLIVKFGVTRAFMFYYAVNVMLYDKRSLFIVNRFIHNRGKDAEGPVCVAKRMGRSWRVDPMGAECMMESSPAWLQWRCLW